MQDKTSSPQKICGGTFLHAIRHVGLDIKDNTSLYVVMQNEQLTWAIVDNVAATLGVDAPARRKWRQRRVPFEWRFKIIEKLATDGVTVTGDAFDALPINPGRIAA
jgi:hypothetical protein